jgi:hypothetical protein
MNIVANLREKLGVSEKGPITTQATLKDMLVVTWAVSEETLRPLVPAPLLLDRLPGPDGQLMGFVQASFALRLGARWTPLPAEAGDSYHHADVRILTRSQSNKRGAYVLKSYVGKGEIYNALYPVSRAIEDAKFTVFVAGDPAKKTFEKMSVRATVEALELHLVTEATETPEQTNFGRWTEFAQFLTDREQICHPARLSKTAITLLPTQLDHPTPIAVKCTLGIVTTLSALNLGEPVAACYVPSVTVTGFPARPYRAD